MRTLLTAFALLAAAPALAQPTADSFTSPTPTGLRAGAVRSGMDYSAFRRALLGAGWQVVRDPGIRLQIGPFQHRRPPVGEDDVDIAENDIATGQERLRRFDIRRPRALEKDEVPQGDDGDRRRWLAAHTCSQND